MSAVRITKNLPTLEECRRAPAAEVEALFHRVEGTAHSNLWGSYYDGRLGSACTKRLVALRERAEALGVSIGQKTYPVRPDA